MCLKIRSDLTSYIFSPLYFPFSFFLSFFLLLLLLLLLVDSLRVFLFSFSLSFVPCWPTRVFWFAAEQRRSIGFYCQGRLFFRQRPHIFTKCVDHQVVVPLRLHRLRSRANFGFPRVQTQLILCQHISSAFV